jgi:hypothetical protein
MAMQSVVEMNNAAVVQVQQLVMMVQILQKIQPVVKQFN